jgi:hypothetical protein
MQPQPLDRVEFGRVGRQKDETEVVWHHQMRVSGILCREEP